MRIVIVEDDRHTVEDVVEDLAEEFPSAKFTILRTERGFRESLQSISQSPPDLFIIDVMLAWDYPRADRKPPPQSVARDGYFRAGLRCSSLINEVSTLKHVPRVFFTALSKDDVETSLSTSSAHAERRVVEKDGRSDELVRAVRRIVR